MGFKSKSGSLDPEIEPALGVCLVKVKWLILVWKSVRKTNLNQNILFDKIIG